MAAAKRVHGGAERWNVAQSAAWCEEDGLGWSGEPEEATAVTLHPRAGDGGVRTFPVSK